jgi:soluble lytic murein transglycosylase-like protein
VRSVALAGVAALAVGACSQAKTPSAVLGGTEVPRGRAPTTTVAAPAPADDTPAAVAAHLGAVEAAIRDPAVPEAELARLGLEEQALYRVVLLHPDWHPAVVALVPESLRPAVEANLVAGMELAKLAPPPRPEPPRWRIVVPAPAAELVADYRAAEAAVGVPWPYLAAIHLVETNMGRIRGESTAGAQGPMQFLPATWASYGGGGDINSNHDAILAAARLLDARGAPARMGAALFGYNPSDHYVKAVTAYAGVMAADARAYLAYHAWQVYYGDRLLPEGFVG